MHAEIKEKWVNALRSGSYKQTTGMLRSADNRFCCLGVLCNLVDDAGWKLAPGLNAYTYGEYESNCWPNDEVLGLTQLPTIEMNKLASQNDKGATFDEIADYIEAKL